MVSQATEQSPIIHETYKEDNSRSKENSKSSESFADTASLKNEQLSSDRGGSYNQKSSC